MVVKRLKTQFGSLVQRPQWVVAFLLALAASGVSLAAAAYGGWGRGVDTPQKILMSSIACIVVFGAHFLPTLLDSSKRALSMIIVLLWLACSVSLVYGHTQLFLLAQQGVGDARVDNYGQVNPVATTEPDRKLSRVLVEKAKVQSSLANINACQSSCERLQSRREFLKGQLEALIAEEREWERWEDRSAKAEQAKQKVAQDQVLAQASAFLNVRYDLLAFSLGILFSMILEGVAAVCWYCLFNGAKSPANLSSRTEVTSPQAVSNECIAIGCEEDSDIQAAVAEVRAGIQAGTVACTVKSIRSYLGCAQEKASKVRRHLITEDALQAG